MSKHKPVFFGAITGNVLEYYDFTVYAIFSLAIGAEFFPILSDFGQVISSLAIFAIGFLTRPLGGIVFGYIGDRYGRRVSLICSMVGMTIATGMMGVLPNYDQIGIAAPILLSILRLVQGLCLSGEGAGTAIFILEHYKDYRSGLMTSLVQCSNIGGALSAMFVAMCISSYADSQDAWRIAFIIGGVVGIGGCILRLGIAETPIFQEMIRTKHLLVSPFKHVLRDAWRPMVVTAVVGGYSSSMVYLIKTYVNVFFSNIMHFEDVDALSYAFYSALILMIFTPIFGHMADLWGKVRIIKASAVAVILFSIPILSLMSASDDTIQVLGLTLLGALTAASSACAYLFVISLFKPEERFTGVGFSYNLGVAIFGGTSPMISRWLVEATELHYAPALYVMCISALLLYVLSRPALYKVKKK